MSFYENTEHDYHLAKDVVEGVTLSSTHKFIDRVVLGCILRGYANLSRSAEGEALPWARTGGTNSADGIVLIALALSFAGILLSILNNWVEYPQMWIVTIASLIPIIALSLTYVKIKMRDPKSYAVIDSYVRVAQSLGEYVDNQQIREWLVLMEKGEVKNLTSVDYIKTATHLINAHEMKEKERLGKLYVTDFVDGGSEESEKA